LSVDAAVEYDGKNHGGNGQYEHFAIVNLTCEL